jgi:hypothetical protein
VNGTIFHQRCLPGMTPADLLTPFHWSYGQRSVSRNPEATTELRPPPTIPATIPDSMMLSGSIRATGVFADVPYPFVVHSASILVTCYITLSTTSPAVPSHLHPTPHTPTSRVLPNYSHAPWPSTLPRMSICTSLPHVPRESIVYALRSAAWDDATSSCSSTHATPGRSRFRRPIFSMALPTDPPSFIDRGP